ncbi:MAG: glycosyltransferase family 4 protein [Lachnospiraceae bacterium]|nr:glycosyltransferase family 4 protein [Lachnospiraceae bacterium]
MNKKILITSTDLMMIQFLIPHIVHLSQNGFDVEIACSEVGGRMVEVKKAVEGYAEKVHMVNLVRSPISPSNFKGYKEMKKILKENHYDLIWTNEPVMGVVTRLAARETRKNGTKVLYMTHGFHFYKGSSIMNWIIFYPIERIFSGLCDEIVTINREDYEMACKFHSKKVEWIDGIGLDTEKFKIAEVDAKSKRKELEVPDKAFLLVSVGELQHRKNHEVIIKALGEIQNTNIFYLICGRGVLLDKLKSLTSSLGLENNVKFLGYRRDVLEILHSADLYVHPSKREGLGIAALEAMACGLPLLTSNVGGLPDFVEEGVVGYTYDFNDIKGFREGILRYYNNEKLREQIGMNNIEAVKKYDIKRSVQRVGNIISALVNDRVILERVNEK